MRTAEASPAELWDRLFGVQAEPHVLVPAVTGVLALLLVISHGPWRLARHVLTIVHEAGHALAALMAGRRLRAILLHSDTSGVTVSRGRTTGPGMVFTALAGYPAPALLGLGFSALITVDRMPMVLVLAAAGVLGVLVMVRNAYGIFTVLVAAAVLAAVAFLGTPNIQAAFVYLITWFLLVGSIRPLFELQRKRRRGAAGDSDVDQLARLTGTPAALWLLVIGVLAGLCLVAGGTLLLEPVMPALERALS